MGIIKETGHNIAVGVLSFLGILIILTLLGVALYYFVLKNVTLDMIINKITGG